MELGKCPKCDSKNVIMLHDTERDAEGMDYEAECENCEATITYKLALVDVEYED